MIPVFFFPTEFALRVCTPPAPNSVSASATNNYSFQGCWVDRGIFSLAGRTPFPPLDYFPVRLSVVGLALGTWALMAPASDNIRIFGTRWWNVNNIN